MSSAAMRALLIFAFVEGLRPGAASFAQSTVIDLAGTSVTSTATGHGGSVTFDPAKLIRKDWSGRS